MPEQATSPSPASVLLAVLPEIVHEMSQPLGTLRCGIEIAQMRGQANGRSADMQLWLEQTERLTELLGVLRQLTDIENSKLAPAACELDGLIRAILNDLRPIAEPRGITLRLESPRPLRAQVNDSQICAALQAVLAQTVERAAGGGDVSIALRPVKEEAWISISGLRPQAGEWPISMAQASNGCGRVPPKKIWPLVLAQSAIYHAGGMIQYDAAVGGDGNLLIRLPLARRQ